MIAWCVMACVAAGSGMTDGAAVDAGASQVVQDTAPSAGDAANEDSMLDRFSLDLSVAYQSDYFFRGIAQRSDAFNIQPGARVGFEAVATDDWSLSLFAGSWMAFSDERAEGARDAFIENFYEHDTYAGVSIGVGRVSLDTTYTWYNSPSSDFWDTQDITFMLGFDDAGLWDESGVFGVNPWVALAIETRNAASGPDSGVWLGLGVAPSVGLGETALGSATLAFPVTLGLSLDDYYQYSDGESDTFGYFEAGVKVSLALHEKLGAAAPTLDVGVSQLFLGGALDDINGGDASETVVTIATTWSF